MFTETSISPIRASFRKRAILVYKQTVLFSVSGKEDRSADGVMDVGRKGTLLCSFPFSRQGPVFTASFRDSYPPYSGIGETSFGWMVVGLSFLRITRRTGNRAFRYGHILRPRRSTGCPAPRTRSPRPRQRWHHQGLHATGRPDFTNAVLSFSQKMWNAAGEPVAVSDLNGNARFGFPGIVALFNAIGFLFSFLSSSAGIR